MDSICVYRKRCGDNYNANHWANVDKTKDYIDTQKQELDGAIGDLDDTISTAFSDGVITNIEAQGLKIARDSVVKEATDVKAIATSLQVSTTALTTAINALNTEVNKYVGKSSYPIVVTAANRTALNNAFTALEAAIVALYDTIEQERIADVSDSLTGYINGIKGDLEGLIDGKIDTWFYSVTPTLNNDPAVNWTTDTIRDKHLDDLYYNTANGYVYRFVYESNAYKWVRIKDTDIVAAMQAASLAKDTADGKRRVFVSQPIPPYDVGRCG